MKRKSDQESTPQSRRQFLKFAASLPLLTYSQQTLTKKASPKTVIIVGAGMAGLAAANLLKSKGHNVLILEARERVGGRIWTDRSLGTALDFGASWIHGLYKNPITKIAKKLDLKITKTNYESIYAYDHDGSQISDSVLYDYSAEFEEILNDISWVTNFSSHDISVQTAIDEVLKDESLTAFEQRFLDWSIALLEVTAGEDLSGLSAYGNPLDSSFSGGDYLFTDGYDSIPRFLAKDINIEFSQIVKQIQRKTDSITVVTENRTFEADYVIVTVSLGVLQKNSIEFKPLLPKKKINTINTLKMGTLNKIALHFDDAFWQSDRDFFGYIGKYKGFYPTILNWFKYTNKPYLLAFTGGTFARDIENKTEEQVSEDILSILNKIYGSDVSKLLNIKKSGWATDPFAFGSYSHFTVGASKHVYKELQRPVGNILFAGEATNGKYYGTVHGAYLSGLREAERIINS